MHGHIQALLSHIDPDRDIGWRGHWVPSHRRLAARPTLQIRARVNGPGNCSGSGPALGPGRPCSPTVSRDPGVIGLSRPISSNLGHSKVLGTYKGSSGRGPTRQLDSLCPSPHSERASLRMAQNHRRPGARRRERRACYPLPCEPYRLLETLRLSHRCGIGLVTLCSLRGQMDANLEKIETFAQQAAAAGCDLVLFPEFSVHGPWVTYDADADAAELERQSEPIPGPTTERLTRIAASRGLAIGAGIAERGLAPKPFNAYVIVDWRRRPARPAQAATDHQRDGLLSGRRR